MHQTEWTAFHETSECPEVGYIKGLSEPRLKTHNGIVTCKWSESEGFDFMSCPQNVKTAFLAEQNHFWESQACLWGRSVRSSQVRQRTQAHLARWFRLWFRDISVCPSVINQRSLSVTCSVLFLLCHWFLHWSLCSSQSGEYRMLRSFLSPLCEMPMDKWLKEAPAGRTSSPEFLERVSEQMAVSLLRVERLQHWYS